MITGSLGVSFRFPQLFLSQHRLKLRKMAQNLKKILDFFKTFMKNHTIGFYFE